MITTCELPKCLLNKEDELNDFDFVLYHQYLKDDVYKNHYLNKRENNPQRRMILDNSAYEFFISHEEFIENDFIRVIKELKPDFYIVPDVLMNKAKTLENFYHWVDIIKDLSKEVDSIPYFVPQGRTYWEFEECMLKMKIEIDKNNFKHYFCIPFHNEFFARGSLYDPILTEKYFGKHPTADDYYASGRMALMKLIINNPLYNDYKFHMLGSHNPKEINFYKDYSRIESFDSGYPVKLAIEGIELGKEKSKPNIIIDDFYNQDLDDDIKNLIINNIKIMKTYIKAF